ncbi:ParB/RepB/Spo0J family partition protein, partial [Vibrio sp.]|uniref:ParB/RepB/Spo0J family partition protein n=1 Tax=Vibrio sp. TaxID=678 RepID=UPI003D0B5264
MNALTQLDYNSADALSKQLNAYNTAYRTGESLIPDEDYDALVERLAQLEPEHPFLKGVEVEPLRNGKTFRHIHPMKSTNKAYLVEDIEKWLDKIEQAGLKKGISNPVIRATAKLDGVACKYIPDPLLATRGDGTTGNIVTHLLDMGLQILGNTERESIGEIVMPQAYFDLGLSEQFSHPRNVIAGIVNADNHKAEALQALKDGAVHLVLYRDMDAIELPLDEFRAQWESVEASLRDCQYPIDGVVFEAVDPTIKSNLGSTSHHHNWQIAKKIKGNEKVTTVTDVIYQLGRTGQITPVIQIEPVELSGAVTSKVSGSHVGNIIDKKIGVGAEVAVIRSGEIIPFITRILSPASELNIPTVCPCCGGEVEMREDNLYCSSTNCHGRNEAKIIYHFDLLKALYFGKQTVAKIVAGGFTSIEAVYQMTQMDLEACGLGAGQAANLLAEMARIQSQPMPDYLLLASLGISNLGRGSAKKLLAVHPITTLLDITVDDIKAIKGFGDTSAPQIYSQLQASTVLPMLLNTYDIEHTKGAKVVGSSPVAGKSVVFTGKCSLSRGEMSDWATTFGCIPQSRVTGDTDFLVCGDNVGATKMDSAKKKGVAVLSEAQFRELLAQPTPPSDTTGQASVADESEPLPLSNPDEPLPADQPLAFPKTDVAYHSKPNESEAKVMTNATTIAPTTPMTQGEETQLLHLDPNTIQDPKFGNPRRYIADSDYLDLLNSIKARGIHTPLIARYVETGIELVAGNTRKRVAIEIGLPSIPVLVSHMTDEEAYALSVSENVDRTAMSQLDEAHSLKRIVANHNGDLNVAAAEMGWSKTKFDRALQLLRASDEVQALVGKKQDNGFVLSVAHAARLSSLPTEIQNKIVHAVIRDKMSVSVLNDKIQKAVKRPLNTAVFEQSDCAQCPYNTQVQTTMFADDSNCAECTNPSCFQKKTEAHFDQKRQELESEYGKLVLLSTVDSPVTISQATVGSEQYTSGCLSCDKHCAILDDTNGLNQGKILENRCLDQSCASEKAQAWKKATAAKSAQANAQSPTSRSTNAGNANITTNGTTKATTKPQASTPKRLILESQTALKAVAQDLVVQHP